MLTINKANATVTANSSTVTYNGANQSVTTFTASGLVGGETSAVLTGVSVSGTGKNAGTYTTTASGTDSNYNLSFNTGVLTINKANLTAIANNDAKIVTQADNASYNGISYSGFVGGEVLANSGVAGGTITRTNANQSAGSYAGVLSISGLTSNNYNITTVSGNYTIVAADQLLIRVANANTTYGTNASYAISSVQYLNSSNSVIYNLTQVSNTNATYTYTDGVGGQATFTVTPQNASYASSGSLNVGSYQLDKSNTSIVGNNFNAFNLVGALSVGQKSLSIASTTPTKTYDATTSITNASLALAGAVTGDNVSVLANGSYASKNAGTTVNYTLNSSTLSGTDSGNYYMNVSALPYTGTNGVINRAPISSVSNITALNKTYDGTTNATLNTSAAQFNGLFTGDQLTVANATGAFASASPGTNKTVNINGITLGGTDVGNYQLVNTAATTSADIIGVDGSSTSSAALIIGSTLYGGAINAVTSQIATDENSLTTSSSGGRLKSKATQLFVYGEVTRDSQDNKTISVPGQGVNTK